MQSLPEKRGKPSVPNEDVLTTILTSLTKVITDQVQQLRTDFTTEVKDLKTQLNSVVNMLPLDYVRRRDMDNLETEVRNLRSSLDTTYFTRRENDEQRRGYDEFKTHTQERLKAQEDIQTAQRLKTLEDNQTNTSNRKFSLWQMMLSILFGSSTSFVLGVISYLIFKMVGR